TGRESGCVARTRPAGRPARMCRVADRAVPRILTEDAPCELGQVGLADHYSARVEHTLHDRRVPRRDVVGVDARPVRRADPRGVDQILDEHGATGERAVRRAAQRLVEPRDDSVPRIAHGSTAIASTSIFAPGTASAETSTSVDARRDVSNTRCRTGLIAARSS